MGERGARNREEGGWRGVGRERCALSPITLLLTPKDLYFTQLKSLGLSLSPQGEAADGHWLWESDEPERKGRGVDAGGGGRGGGALYLQGRHYSPPKTCTSHSLDLSLPPQGEAGDGHWLWESNEPEQRGRGIEVGGGGGGGELYLQ